MKKVLYSLLTILLIFTFCLKSPVLAYDEEYNIRDFAGVLSRSELEELNEIAEKFYDTYGLELVILIVDDGYNEYTLERFGDHYFDTYIGDTEYGIYLALDVTNADDDDYIAVVKGSSSNYTDMEIERIYSILSSVKYDGTYEIAYTFTQAANRFVGKTVNLAAVFILLAAPPIVTLIVLLILISKNRMVKKATTAEAYLNQDLVNISRREDRFITTHTTRVKMSSSSGGSHHGGGSHGMSRGGGGRHL